MRTVRICAVAPWRSWRPHASDGAASGEASRQSVPALATPHPVGHQFGTRGRWARNPKGRWSVSSGDGSERRLSFLGYLILNLAAAAILLGVYYFASTTTVGVKKLAPFGIAIPCIFVWLCFVGVSVYDAMFDRAADGKKHRTVDPRASRDRVSRERVSRERVSKVSGTEKLPREKS